MNLSTANWVHVVKEALVVGVGAGITYLSQYMVDADFGDMTPVVVAGWSVAVNYLRKLYVGDTSV